MSQDRPYGEAESAQPPQYAPPNGAYQQGTYQNGAPYYVPYAVPVQAPQTNTLSILALIAAFLAPFVVPVVLGHISLNQIRRTGEGGRGLAIAALVLGYIQIAFWVLFIAFIIWVGVVAAASSAVA
ncbi:DUF4190 domain-containing protein [Leucobacter luti]|uniref:Uncharacterized protein DUF4190 n=1 Tax=Leucobacter luti TaxID=340320 RepID=A0A4R6SAD4_9MICO|nr:DUF4190 domain-containing protein [Leucobacter luti]TDP95815.1 uncharacterized protein DUF4190 [Leucobacter luti]